MSNHQTHYTLAARFKALSNPNRLALFTRLMRCCPPGTSCAGEEMACCVGDLGAGLDIAPSTLSHHLKELTQAGLVRTERQGKTILCWVDPDVLVDLAGFFTGCPPPETGEAE